MKNKIIAEIKREMKGVLNKEQMELLVKTLEKYIDIPLVSDGHREHESSLLLAFISAKRVEGCSEKSLIYYESTIKNMLDSIDKSEEFITTEDLRKYLDS